MTIGVTNPSCILCDQESANMVQTRFGPVCVPCVDRHITSYMMATGKSQRL